MSTYISSSQNRFYSQIESSYGVAPGISASNRLSAVQLKTDQTLTLGPRRDKTGSRTFPGTPAGGRRKTTFSLRTYLGSWSGTQNSLGTGPLVQAALGLSPLYSSGGTLTELPVSTQLTYAAPHGLVNNQAVSLNGEIRFVVSVIDTLNIIINAPFTTAAGNAVTTNPTLSFLPSTTLPSVSIYDYWSPISAVQRLIVGAGVNTMTLSLNGDYHEFEFQGTAKDIIDSTSFSTGEAGLTSYPTEPAAGFFDLTTVPGNLGQVWLGANAQTFQTLTAATITVSNNLDERSQDFGSSTPLALSPGNRTVSLDISLFETTDSATTGLYQAARQRSPISAMFQLGQANGQLCGCFMNSVVPELPSFDDTQPRLRWHFNKSRAQGTIDNEVSVAFA